MLPVRSQNCFLLLHLVSLSLQLTSLVQRCIACNKFFIRLLFQHSLITTIHVPRTTFYQIYVVYSMSTTATISITLRLQKNSFILSSGSLPTTAVNFCSGICFKMFSVAATSFFNLEIGTWNVTVTSMIAESQLKLVSNKSHPFILKDS